MATFDLAFEQAVAKSTPASLSDIREKQVVGTPLEKLFGAVDNFEFDPSRLVVSATVVGEQYRTLKANIAHLGRSGGLGSIVFTSSLKGEGKTTVVVNLARELAREPAAKIAVVDCDFKRPGMSDFCSVEPDAGIEDVLSGAASLEECGVYSRRDRFVVFGLRHHGEDTGDLLASASLQRVIGELEAMFDLVLIDTSPVLSTSEPVVLGAKAGAVVLVVRAGVTQRESVLFAQAQLEQAGCRLLGVVINARPSYLPRLWLLRKYEYFPDAYRHKG